MSDKEQEKPTEAKTINVPDIEVTEEGATGGTEDKDNGKKSALGTFTHFIGKGVSLIKGKRSKSKSPETRNDKTQMGAESSKGDFKLAAPPSKKGTAAYIRDLLLTPSKRGHHGEETKNLYEQQVVPHADVHLAPPEDQGISISPSPVTETMAEKCVMHEISSSVSSAPSGYSSLPDDNDDDTDIASPDDLNSPDDGKRK